MQSTSKAKSCHKAEQALDILVKPQSQPKGKKDRFK